MIGNFKMFKRLGYASVVLGAFEIVFLRGLSKADFAGVSVIFAIALLISAALIWAAAGDGKWAAWLLVLLLIFGLLGDLGNFWSGGPASFQAYFGADPAETVTAKFISLASNLLMAIALYFYFQTAPAPVAVSPAREH